jgi:formylglycine-generating enzyme required for sulfatase activity
MATVLPQIVARERSAIAIAMGVWYLTRPGTVKWNPKDGLKYVWVPPGTFMMGCSPGDSECGANEKPAHRVSISKGFWLGQMEVTVAAYRRHAGTMPPAPDFNAGWSNQEMPILNVTWDDAAAYCEWAGGRLPTEYAARAAIPEARYGPADEIAWYSGNSYGRAHEVARKRPNPFDLHDMLGNVSEWVNDRRATRKVRTGKTAGETVESSAATRGTSHSPRISRVSSRHFYWPDFGPSVGFRCVLGK